MMELGATFRKTRESLNVSIDKIAEETRISTRFLKAIENEQFELLPGGIFNRGFIRTYASRLSLDPDEAVLAYEKKFRPAEAEPAREPENARGQTTKLPVYHLAIVGLLILVVTFYFATRHSEPSLVANSAPAAATPAPKQEPAAAPALQASLAVTTPETPVPAPIPAAPIPSPAAAAPPPAPAPPTATSNGPIVMELEVREESWFKLSSDGNGVVAGEILQPGITRRYTANNSMEISFGNAGGVTLRLNGQAVSSLGKSGQVRNLTITPTTSAASLTAASR